jgi:catechol 2,3-dioxygenase-like lactoylglutathione lyase family enzyme
MTIKAITHVGICVSDLERSTKFYNEGLGFELARAFSVEGPEWGRVLEIDDLRVEGRMLRREGFVIELLCYDSPGSTGDGGRRAMNALGFTHLAVWVDDVDAAADRLTALGGSLVEHTALTVATDAVRGRWVYCTDPDGVRIELIEHDAWRPVVLGAVPDFQ